MLPGATCTGSLTGQFENISLSDIQIYAPQQSAGVLLGSPRLPMRGLTFTDVVVHAGCDTAAHLRPGGFEAAFPLLPVAVPPDMYVHIFFVLIAVVAALVLLVARAFWVRAASNSRSFVAGVGALLLGGVGALAARLAVLSPAMTSGYYVCEGIEDGVAMGSTWPVPPCFIDRTTRQLTSPERLLPCANQHLGWLGVGSALAVLFAAACMRRAWHERSERGAGRPREYAMVATSS